MWWIWNQHCAFSPFPVSTCYVIMGKLLILSEPCFCSKPGIVDVMVLLKVAVSEKDQHGWGWQQVLVSAGTFPPSE